MATIKTVIPIIENTKINPRYDISLQNAFEIKERWESAPLEAISNAFTFGYAQGVKAAAKALLEEKE